MDQAASILKIVAFILLGILFRKSGALKKQDMDGVKKVIVHMAIPAVLFLSFSRLKFDAAVLPITAVVFSINLILFWAGYGAVKLSGGRGRLLPLYLSSMNFALLGIPLYEAVYGLDNLHHYTVLGIGNELFTWFVYYFLLRWYLSGGNKNDAAGDFNWGFVKSPIVWSIILGCLCGAMGWDLTAGRSVAAMTASKTLQAAASVTTPLILIFIGFKMSLSRKYFKVCTASTVLRLGAMLLLGFLLKLTVLDRFTEPTALRDAAYLLLLSLPPVFSLPILADEFLDDEETVQVNNIIVFHAAVTVVLFALTSLFIF